jgi:hypothetical protein
VLVLPVLPVPEEVVRSVEYLQIPSMVSHEISKRTFLYCKITYRIYSMDRVLYLHSHLNSHYCVYYI